MPELFSLDLSVRDYECDLQGIVNNAVYQHYLEHARHEFLRGRGLDFAALTRAGVHMVVMRAELDYLRPLTSGDRFRVTLKAERLSFLKVLFHQQLLRQNDGVPLLRARITAGVVARGGRDALPAPLTALLDTLPRGAKRRRSVPPA